MSDTNPVIELYLEAVTGLDEAEAQMSIVKDWYFAIAFTIMRHYGEAQVPAEWEFEPSDYDRANIATVDGDIQPRIQTATLETLLEAGDSVIEDGLLIRDEQDEDEYEEGYDPTEMASLLRSVGYSVEVANDAAYASRNAEDATERAVIMGGR